jgi:hypothetical protein
MTKWWRVELRLFGLLAVALTVTLILYAGLTAADVRGGLLGMRVRIAGPPACFVALILMFWQLNLFTMGVEVEVVSNRPVEKLSRENAERMLDELEIQERRIQRRRAELGQYVKVLDAGKAGIEAWAAAGLRPAIRRGVR